MNPQLTYDLAICQARDLERAADRHRKLVDRRGPSAANAGHLPSALRRRIGFTLVTAGLQLLASAAD